ncbi:MAG: glycosyltransferase family 4 protein [Bacteriovoracaceae bacterium]|nr:glycosyltransferase family 4 protein [Bacteriovoracaceae bacterium]
MKKTKLVLIYNSPAIWVENDLEILSENYETKALFINSFRDYNVQNLKSLMTADIYYFWFGSLIFFPAILLASFLRRKKIVVAGGYDVAAYHKENYGAFTFSFVSRLFRRIFFLFADKILAVSRFTKNEAIKNANIKSHKIEVIYNTVKNFYVNDEFRKKSVIMVANIDDERYRIKGFDRLLELAKAMPDVCFTHVGKISTDIAKTISFPKNLKLCGHYTESQLIELYKKHSHALQPSRYESFCMTIIEAAACGCYPITSDEGALPEVIDGIGKAVSFDSLDNVIGSVRNELTIERSAKDISIRTLDKYGFSVRQKKLLEYLRGFL